MLLYHPLHKTFDDSEEVHRYIFHGNGDTTLIETDKELKAGQFTILRDIAGYSYRCREDMGRKR